MPISHAVWTVSKDPREVPQGILDRMEIAAITWQDPTMPGAAL